MDELDMLGTLLAAPEPAQETVDRGRHRLQNTIWDGPRKRRARWVVAGLGLTAAAAAGAVVIASAVTAPPGKPNSPPAGTALSGRQVLLAAASTAETAPAAAGTYWQLESTAVSPDGRFRDTFRSWTHRDGRTWVSSEPGKISKLDKPKPITVRNTDIGLAELQRLPTDPDRLKATLLSHMKTRPESGTNLVVFGLLATLLTDVPAPPKVRAAAFRALAARPKVENLGKTTAGYQLRITEGDGGSLIIVDLESTRVTTEGFTTFGEGRQSMGALTRSGKWVDRLPPYKFVPLSRQERYGISCTWQGGKPVCQKVRS